MAGSRAGYQSHIWKYNQNILFFVSILGLTQTGYKVSSRLPLSHQLKPVFLHSNLKTRAVTQPDKQNSDRQCPELLVCGTTQIHDSISGPKNNGHMYSLPHSKWEEDDKRDSEGYPGPSWGLMDGNWWWKTVPRQGTKYHHCWVAAMIRTDCVWWYFYSCHVDYKE